MAGHRMINSLLNKKSCVEMQLFYFDLISAGEEHALL